MQNKNVIVIGIFAVITILGAILINNLFKNGVIGGSSSSTDTNIVTKIINVDDIVEVEGIKTTSKNQR